MTQDRRRNPRLIPDSALLVSVGRLRRAFLSDLSEGGMAFDGLVAENSASVISLAFELPDNGGAIEAMAEVVWTCDSLHRTGVRFAELAEDCRRRLREWLSTRVVTLENTVDETPGISLSGMTGAAREWILQEIGESEAPPQVPAVASKVRTSRWTAARRASFATPGIVLALIAMSLALIAVGYYLPALMPSPKASGLISSLESPAPFSPSASIKNAREATARAPAVATDFHAKDEGFVLQVGAMAHQENAEALATKLRQKSFPVFVFYRAGDGLYRVDIGPYPDAGYARDVKSELTGAGFRTVLERHLPR